jgi:uncharacterized protein YgiM (DUF1202 family)
MKTIAVVTRSNPLRVRETPAKNGKILGRVGNGSRHTVSKENKEWYLIEYAPGKKGWIFKKFTKAVK